MSSGFFDVVFSMFFRCFFDDGSAAGLTTIRWSLG